MEIKERAGFVILQCLSGFWKAHILRHKNFQNVIWILQYFMHFAVMYSDIKEFFLPALCYYQKYRHSIISAEHNPVIGRIYSKLI
jgi:hypothetical protein